MMIKEIQKLVDGYWIWLKDKTSLRQVENWVEITTPYLDRHNDYLQIYVKRENSGYIITDDGFTIQDLKESGCDLDSKKRKDLLALTLNGFGVKPENEALVVHASPDNFSLRKHNLVQAILSVNDLFYMAKPIVASLFLEDVTTWLDLNDIRYTPRVKFTGKSGYDYLFDFVIPASKKQPERILQTINHPDRNTATKLAFAWAIDTKEIRPPNSRAYAFLNDSENAAPRAVIEALKSYEVHPILWTQRDVAREELVA